MTLFIALAIALLLLCLSFILLWQKKNTTGRQTQNQPDRDQLNIDIAREKIAELDNDLQAGRINSTEYQNYRNEIEGTLLVDVSSSQNGGELSGTTSSLITKITPVLLIIVVPLISGLLYIQLGTPTAIRLDSLKQQNSGSAQVDPERAHQPSMEELIQGLKKRLEQQPDDPQGWFLLGRTYMAQRNFAQAVEALQKTYELTDNNPDVMVAYADALAMSNGGVISGRPFELIEQAKALQPQNPTALWLAGMANAEQGKYARAIELWQQLLPLLSDDAQSTQEVKQLIANASQQIGQSPETNSRRVNNPSVKTGEKAGLQVSVSLSDELKTKIDPATTVYIFARMQGASSSDKPSPPLAVVRKTVAELPLLVTLDDSLAMIPAFRLSNFSEVSVGARISKSGNPIPQDGDITVTINNVAVKPAQTIQLLIK